MQAFPRFRMQKNSDKYIVLPDLCVASEGTVHSLLLFSKVPITDLDKSKIALTTSSETTVHLLQVILKRFFLMFMHHTLTCSLICIKC